MCNQEEKQNCIASVLERIILLQQVGENVPSGCDKPFLGNVSLAANTRPLNLYCCSTNQIWTMPYTLNGTTGTSTFFRVENLNDNCATFRILVPNADGSGYLASNSYFIINLNCVGIVKCLVDTLVTNI